MTYDRSARIRSETADTHVYIETGAHEREWAKKEPNKTRYGHRAAARAFSVAGTWGGGRLTALNDNVNPMIA